jgi:hypothetical protein
MIASVMAPATAWLGSERIVNIGDVVFGVEYVIQKPSATLFHTENLATTDNEALAIAFPVDGSGQVVAPSIAQTAADTASATETGFFTANWCYTALVNPGGYDLTPNLATWHPMKSNQMAGSDISWPYMENTPPIGGSTMSFKPAINSSPDTGNTSLQMNAVGPGTAGLSGTNLSAGKTAPGAGNATPYVSKGNGQGTKPNRDYKNMTGTDIKNMTGLEKMYRNANLRNTVPQTHKGSVARPEAIAPLKQPMDVIKPPNKPQVIRDALNMTHEDTHLKTLFWDL